MAFLSIPANFGGAVKDYASQFANSNVLTSIATRVADQFGLNAPLIYGGVYNKLTDTLIPFLVPESVSRSHSASTEDISIETRSIGMPYYTGGGSPEVSFEVYVSDDFYNMLIQEGVLGMSSPTNYIRKAFALQDGSTINEVLSAFRALTFPEYDRGVAKPPECLIYIGESATYRAICTSVSDTLTGLTGLNRKSQFTYREATISLSFTILGEVTTSSRSNVPSASDIQKNKGGVLY